MPSDTAHAGSNRLERLFRLEPRVWSAKLRICVFSVAVGYTDLPRLNFDLAHSPPQLMSGVVNNANWALSHGSSFTLFNHRMSENADLQWEKVFAAQRMAKDERCDWNLFMDIDAIVRNIKKSPYKLLNNLLADLHSHGASPDMIATCNSPLGNGHSCDTFCCQRAYQLPSGDPVPGGPLTTPTNQRRIPQDCSVGQFDGGPASPYPCLINSGVWFLRGGQPGEILVAKWMSLIKENNMTFGEQNALNLVKAQYPSIIDVVGGQVMNTHASFNRDWAKEGIIRKRVAYDIALRVSSGFEPNVNQDENLNHTLYDEVARSVWNYGIGSKQQLQELLLSPEQPCLKDAGNFVCHTFAMPDYVKAMIAHRVLLSNMPALRSRLSSEQGMNFSYVDFHFGESETGREETEQQQESVKLEEKIPSKDLEENIPSDKKIRGNTRRHSLNAVCISGAMRTFLQMEVQEHFVENFHHQGYEYFVSTDTPKPNSTALKVSPIRAWDVTPNDPNNMNLEVGRPNYPGEPHRGPCPPGTCDPGRFLLPFVQKFAECYYSMLQYEGKKGRQYDLVLRVRPDHLFLKRIPMATPDGWMNIQLRPGKILLWDDQISAAFREDAATTLLAPSIAYSACTTVRQWEAAAQACEHGTDQDPLWTVEKCRKEINYKKVIPMSLITVFGKATAWAELPIQSKSWEKKSPNLDDSTADFCIKRDEYMNTIPMRNRPSGWQIEWGLSC